MVFGIYISIFPMLFISLLKWDFSFLRNISPRSLLSLFLFFFLSFLFVTSFNCEILLLLCNVHTSGYIHPFIP